MEYPAAFKTEMVRKMSGPHARSARELAGETGVHQTTLSYWKREASKLDDMSRKKIKIQTRPVDKTPKEKLELVIETSLLTDEKLGEFLRRKGLHGADLARWREEALAGLGERRQEKSHAADGKRIRELEKQLTRKDRALAEAAALLILQKKVQAFWGEEDDDTAPRNGR
jgi:transposase-like protein